MAVAASAVWLRRWWITLGSTGVFIALAVSVHLALLDAFDSVIREWARPQDVWGTVQMRADYVVEGLRPAVIAGLLAAFTVALSVIRRSLRPVIFVGGVGLTTVALTVAVKIAVGRLDTHGTTADSNGGSFPSGHVIAIVVCLGLAVLMTQSRARPWVWLIPALVGGLMGACLMVQAAHWSTDIVGGGLLGIGVLTAVTASGWDRWSLRPPANHLTGTDSGRVSKHDARPAEGGL
jgi:membrane-associated phospholipid phosphatase